MLEISPAKVVHIIYQSREGAMAERELHAFIRGLNDGLTQLCIKRAERHVRERGGFLLNAECAHDCCGHFLRSDVKILHGALRLRTPIGVCRHFNIAEGIRFDADWKRA